MDNKGSWDLSSTIELVPDDLGRCEPSISFEASAGMLTHPA